jgi:hypothetical protein
VTESILRRLLLAASCALSGARPAGAEGVDDAAFAALRRQLADAYQGERAAASAALGELARAQPGRRAEWLRDPDPVLRRAAARLLEQRPDAELAPALIEALRGERDPAVTEALIAALVRIPERLAELPAAAPDVGKARPSGAGARLLRALACGAIASKVRDGAIPGFYDGQFSSFWTLSAAMPGELLAIARDDSYHLVVRILAVMALHETRRPSLERDFALLIKPEDAELEMTISEFRDRIVGRSPSAVDLLRRREFVISKYARFSLAKAGQTAAILRLIREVDAFLGAAPQRSAIAVRADRDERFGYWWAEFLRELAFDVGYYYQQFDDYASAEQRYRDLLDRFPESRVCENAHYNLACICAIQGRRREALDHLRAAIRCGFTNHAWLLEDADFASVRGDPEFLELVELARTGGAEESGRDWIRKLQRFLPAGTRSFFELDPEAQREVLGQARLELTPAQKRRLVEDAPEAQRAWIETLLSVTGD